MSLSVQPKDQEGMSNYLDRPIANGGTAEIYAWKEGEILKLFKDYMDLASIEREARISRAVFASGLPVPAAGEIVQVNGRFGLVYERVEGSSMWEELAKRPWRCIRSARRMAELHADMHASTTTVDLPSQRLKLVGKFVRAKALGARLQSKAVAALEAMPDGDRLCHGDFHPGNILVSPNGERIIDWLDASCGNHLADLARTTILIRGGAETSQIPNAIVRPFLRLLHVAYVRHYFRLRPGGRDEYRQWLPIVAAARVSEEIPELEAWLIAQAEKVR